MPVIFYWMTFKNRMQLFSGKYERSHSRKTTKWKVFQVFRLFLSLKSFLERKCSKSPGTIWVPWSSGLNVLSLYSMKYNFKCVRGRSGLTEINGNFTTDFTGGRSSPLDRRNVHPFLHEGLSCVYRDRDLSLVKAKQSLTDPMTVDE